MSIFFEKLILTLYLTTSGHDIHSLFNLMKSNKTHDLKQILQNVLKPYFLQQYNTLIDSELLKS